MSLEKGKKCLQCFRVLSDHTRIRIVKELQERSESVSEITEHMGVTQPTISYHLKLLDGLGLIQKKRKGRETYYAFNKDYPCRGCGVFTAPIKVGSEK